eukprot:TRINITY_DN23256_c0_g1_i1.p1 TRINITY_DN23256_c0_g1~~TRINITY_DN23256_c0_g1_i1.p1  ORF type:complete len:501 (+),score=76.06 TRINITY_DN23256_c0_g1_i1:77-1504(+)
MLYKSRIVFKCAVGRRGGACRVQIRCCEQFREQLRQPDHITVSRRKAKQLYNLTDEHLERLKPIAIPNPYGNTEDAYELYWLSDVVEMAKQHKTEEELLHLYERHKKKGNYEAKRKIYGMGGIDRWYSNPSSVTPEGKKSIMQGLQSNMVIFGGKLIASKITGSFALFADAMHSLADVTNYMYRYYSISNSMKDGDQDHPYGYAPLRHICADRSFVGLLIVGGIIPLSVGVYELSQFVDHMMHPPVDMTMASVSMFILAISMCMEWLAMRTAAGEMAERQKLGKSSDIMSSATHLEAKAGVYGVLVGMCGVGCTILTGNPIVEIACSSLMGGIVTFVACRLLSVSGRSLLGATLPVDRVTTVIEKLQMDEVVVEVYDVKTQVLGTDTVRFKAEIHYNAEAITKKLRHIHSIDSEGATALYKEMKQLETIHETEDWLMKNNAEFLMAFAAETARLRDIVRGELSEYRKVHVDLNIW